MKGSWFIVTAVLLSVIGLCAIWSFLSAKYSPSSNMLGIIGAKQAQVTKAYAQGHALQSYLNLAYPYAFEYATARMARSGGVITEEGIAPCGHYLYTLWNNETADCTPDVATSLTKYTNDELAPFIQANPSFGYYELPFPSIDLRRTTSDPFISNGTVFHQPRYLMFGQGTDLNIPIGNIPAQQRSGPTNIVPIDSTIPCTGNACQLTAGAAEQLKLAHTELKRLGWDITITSSYRSLEQQQRLWNACISSKPLSYCRENVAQPSSSSPHVTGGAVDMQITNKNLGQSGWQYTGTYSADQLALQQELCQIMRSMDFIGYDQEWWHFEYGTKRWQDNRGNERCAAP